MDVLQETFAYVSSKFPGFKLTASMTTFLYPVVKHISLNIAQKNKRFVQEKENQEPVSDARPDAPSLEHAELKSVLDILPDELREVLLMRYIEDMSYEEIAEALSAPVGTIKSRLHRALQILRQDSRTRKYFLE